MGTEVARAHGQNIYYGLSRGYGYGDNQIDKIEGYIYLVERCLGIFPQAAGALKSTEAIWKIPTQPYYPQIQQNTPPPTVKEYPPQPQPQPQLQQPRP